MKKLIHKYGVTLVSAIIVSLIVGGYFVYGFIDDSPTAQEQAQQHLSPVEISVFATPIPESTIEPQPINTPTPEVQSTDTPIQIQLTSTPSISNQCRTVCQQVCE